MARHKRQVFAIVIFVVVLGAAALSFALTEIGRNQAAAPILPIPATTPTQSPANQNPTATNTPFTAPTETPTSTPPPTPLQATSVNGSFELTISVEKTVYSVGEPVNITLSITNISKQTVNFTHTGMDFDFVVTNDTDNVIYQWSIGRAFPMFVMIEPLQPGENVTATYTWSQVCNANTSTVGTLVSPGTYYIVGKSNSIYGLRTAPVQIVIVSS
jgi:cytoskeletal protein RodZ